MTIGKDLDIGALVLLLYKDWDLDPLHPRSRFHFRKAPCAQDQLELARIYLRLGKDKKAGDRYRVCLGLADSLRLNA